MKEQGSGASLTMITVNMGRYLAHFDRDHGSLGRTRALEGSKGGRSDTVAG